MIVLALETSQLPGTIALIDDSRLLGEAELPSATKTAQTLVPAIAQLLEKAGRQAKQVELVAVSHGPGSFTGLRIGVTCAKTFAFAAGAQVLGIDTLRACAAQAGPGTVEAVISAQRGELCVARYECNEDSATEISETRLIAIDEWLAELSPEVIYTGLALNRLAERLPAGTTLAPAELWLPQAATIARLALADHAAGVRQDTLALAPHYFRPSYAEDKRPATK